MVALPQNENAFLEWYATYKPLWLQQHSPVVGLTLLARDETFSEEEKEKLVNVVKTTFHELFQGVTTLSFQQEYHIAVKEYGMPLSSITEDVMPHGRLASADKETLDLIFNSDGSSGERRTFYKPEGPHLLLMKGVDRLALEGISLEGLADPVTASVYLALGRGELTPTNYKTLQHELGHLAFLSHHDQRREGCLMNRRDISRSVRFCDDCKEQVAHYWTTLRHYQELFQYQEPF